MLRLSAQRVVWTWLAAGVTSRYRAANQAKLRFRCASAPEKRSVAVGLTDRTEARPVPRATAVRVLLPRSPRRRGVLGSARLKDPVAAAPGGYDAGYRSANCARWRRSTRRQQPAPDRIVRPCAILSACPPAPSPRPGRCPSL